MAPKGAQAADLGWKGLYRIGGLTFLLDGVLLIFTIALFPTIAPLFSNSEGALKLLATQAPLPQIFLFLVIPVDLILIPGLIALCLSLKGINKSAMLVAGAFLGLFIVLDFGVGGLNGLTLIPLSQGYAAATSDAQRAAYVAAANYPLAAFAVALPIFSTLVPSIGFLITSLVMLKGIFPRVVAYFGMATSIIGIIGSLAILVSALFILLILFVGLLAIWFLLVGYILHMLGTQ